MATEKKISAIWDYEPETACDIWGYVNCSKCLEELPPGTSPSDFARINAGPTSLGFQFWCVRHNCNIAHVELKLKDIPSSPEEPPQRERQGARRDA